MTWAPQTPAGFVLAPTPLIVRRLVPRRFSTHFFLPLNQDGDAKDKAVLTLSREVPDDPGHAFHVSTVIKREELEAGGSHLYARFISHAIDGLDNRVGKKVAA